MTIAPIRPTSLTARELEVLELVSHGHAANRTARLLGISERTVHKHLERGYSKLGVHDRMSAYQRLLALGLLELPMRSA